MVILLRPKRHLNIFLILSRFQGRINIMKGAQKILGVFIFAAFVLVAGSVVCLASGEPALMSDCGNQMNGIAMCPFMSASLPIIAATSFKTEISVILAISLALVGIAAVLDNDRRKTVAFSRYVHSDERPPISFLNSTLRLISQGILHSRVFGF